MRTIIIEALKGNKEQPLFLVHFVEANQVVGKWPIDEAGVSALVANWLYLGERPF